MTSLAIVFYSVLLLVVLSKVHAKRNFEIYLDFCNCTVNPIYSEPCICRIDKTVSPPKGFLDVQLHHQLNNVYLSLHVFLVRNNNEEYTLFNSTDIDVCALLNSGGKSALPLIQIVREVMLKGGNLPEKCPVDKDYHFLFNELSIDSEQFPPYVPETRFGVHSKFTEGTKFLMFFECYGEVVQKSNKRWG